MIKSAIEKICQGNDLTEQETFTVISHIMKGQASEIEIAAFITGLRVKGETSDEITGGVRSLFTVAEKINPEVSFCVDPVGTGGDSTGTINISSAAALVASAAGATVAKHGNRSVSSKSGSADFYEALGFDLTLTPKEVEKSIEEIGFGFMYAPVFHPAMRYASPVRKQLGIRTIFNVLGPLTNPAGAKGQVLGVYSQKIMPYVAQALKQLGTKHALVVHGCDSSDEITISGETLIYEIKDNQIEKYTISPEFFGLQRSDISSIKGDSPKDNVNILMEVFKGKKGSPRDVVLMNAAATLYVGQVAATLNDGYKKAEYAIDNGLVIEKIEQIQKIRHQERG